MNIYPTELSNVYKIIFLFIAFIICAIILPTKYKPFSNEFFEQVKIKLKPNPMNINLNNNIINGTGCGTGRGNGYGSGNENGYGGAVNNNYPDIIVPVYAPWRTYWPASSVYPYYPFYPYYYNNYYWPYY